MNRTFKMDIFYVISGCSKHNTTQKDAQYMVISADDLYIYVIYENKRRKKKTH